MLSTVLETLSLHLKGEALKGQVALAGLNILCDATDQGLM